MWDTWVFCIESHVSQGQEEGKGPKEASLGPRLVPTIQVSACGSDVCVYMCVTHTYTHRIYIDAHTHPTLCH